MANVQRTGRICGNKLEQYARRLSGFLSTVARTLIENVQQLGMKGRGAKVKIDKTRPCDVDLVDLFAVANSFHEHRGELSRILAGRLGQPHRDVARKITVRRIACSLNGTLNREIAGSVRKLRHVCEGILYQLRDYGLHFSGLAEFASRNSTGNFVLVA